MESILTSIKKLLGLTADYTHFDSDIIMHINTALMVLTQLGIGPTEGFAIEDELTTWEDLIPDYRKHQAVKTYIYLKVKLAFDPPLSAAAITAINEQIDEYEWRLNVSAETPQS